MVQPRSIAVVSVDLNHSLCFLQVSAEGFLASLQRPCGPRLRYTPLMVPFRTKGTHLHELLMDRIERNLTDELFPAKGSYGMEGQLHTVIEKSPESSPTTKPRQGGGFLQPPSPTRPSASPTPQPARTVLPTSVFPVAQPEPHYAHMPSSGPGPGLCGVEESSQGLQSATPTVEGPPETRTEERNSHPTSLFPHPPYPPPASAQLRTQTMEANR